MAAALFLPLDLRCCWINQPIILLSLTPPNLLHGTCRPVAPLSHLRMPILIHGVHRKSRIWQMTPRWSDSTVIHCSGSWSRTTTRAVFWDEAPLDKIKRCQSDAAVNSQLSISAKKTSSPCPPRWNSGWFLCVGIYRDDRNKKRMISR